MPRHNTENNYTEKRKHLRHNVHSMTQAAPLPHATAIGANKKSDVGWNPRWPIFHERSRSL